MKVGDICWLAGGNVYSLYSMAIVLRQAQKLDSIIDSSRPVSESAAF